MVPKQHSEPDGERNRGHDQQGEEKLVHPQPADESSNELADHDAPGEPPEQVERVVITHRKDESVEVREVLGKRSNVGSEPAEGLSEGEPHPAN